MKQKYTLLLACLLIVGQMAFSQEKPKVDKPVRSPWETTTIVDFPTTRNLAKGSLEMMINHRFGKMDNGITDLYGIYAPSNIRMGLSYGITNKLSVGFATEKNNKMQEFEWKYSILRQTRSGAMPIDLSYYGNFVIDARDKEMFGKEFKATNRFSFFNELIVSRKFGAKVSAQLGVSYTHFNAVDSFMRHDVIAGHFGARYKVLSGMTLICEANLPLSLDLAGYTTYEQFEDLEPGGSFGLEFGTSTHAFQIFVSNYEHLVRQANIARNANMLKDAEVLIGFNVTVRF